MSGAAKATNRTMASRQSTRVKGKREAYKEEVMLKADTEEVVEMEEGTHEENMESDEASAPFKSFKRR